MVNRQGCRRDRPVAGCARGGLDRERLSAMRKRVSLLLTSLILASCGGGGSSGGGTPPAANAPPSFTSLQTASVAENGIAAYQATATDPNGNALTFTIDGGADAARFAITGAGALSFNAAPDFDLPGGCRRRQCLCRRAARQRRAGERDAGGEHHCHQQPRRHRGGARRHRLQPAALRRTRSPASSRVYVVEKGGNVYRFDPAERQPHAGARHHRHFDQRRTRPARPRRLSRPCDVAAPVRGRDRDERQCPGAPLHAGPAEQLDQLRHGARHPASRDSTITMAAGSASVPTAMSMSGSAMAAAAAIRTTMPRTAMCSLARSCALRSARGAAATLPAPGNPFLAGGGDPYVFAFGLRNPFRASFSGSTLADRRRRSRRDRGNRCGDHDPAGAQFRLAFSGRYPALFGDRPCGLDPARRRIWPWQRSAAGPLGDRRLCLSRPGDIADRPLCLCRFRLGQYLVGAFCQPRRRSDLAVVALRAAQRGFHSRRRDAQLDSRRSAKTARAICSSSASAATFSWCARADRLPVWRATGTRAASRGVPP